MTTNKTIFKVIFYNESKVYEIFALEVYPSDMMGFVTVEQLTFGERSTLVVDPGEEKLKLEFESVERTYIPTHAIIRIDEVSKTGVAKIIESDSKVTSLPMVPYSTMRDNDTPN
ncbi:MAG: hypothetical protein CBC79_06085 [Gammaproteobacteria bacterium TMED119]|nr:MAG: hypothetical protein CBC79_06085 [Gammaproteobacteria bacterium TMED119]